MLNKNIEKKTMLQIVFYIFLIFPIFKPMYLTTIPIINTLYNGLQILNLFIIIIMTIKNKKISLINILILAFLIILNLSTFLNNGDIKESIASSVRTISLCFLIDYALREKAKEFLKAFEIVLSLLVIINMLTIFMFPNGMYVSNISGYRSNWFLGFKNNHILYILPTILISIINSYLVSNKLSKKTFLIILISLISILKVWSATSIVAILMVIIFLILNKVVKRHILNLGVLISMYVAAFFSIIILRMQNLFSYLIVDLLKKDLTFTGRTYIWDYVIEYIKAKPIIGYGYEYSHIRFNKGYMYHSVHAHNIILEILYQTGIIGLIIISVIIAIIVKRLKKYKENIITKTIIFFSFIYLVMMLIEAYDFEYFFFLFALSNGVPYILECEKNQKKIRLI